MKSIIGEGATTRRVPERRANKKATGKRGAGWGLDPTPWFVLLPHGYYDGRGQSWEPGCMQFFPFLIYLLKTPTYIQIQGWRTAAYGGFSFHHILVIGKRCWRFGRLPHMHGRRVGGWFVGLESVLETR